MKRTQLYLEDESWAALRLRSRESGLTMSELVRQAVRERYLGEHNSRKRAMQAFAGSRSAGGRMEDTESYVRSLRKGQRITRLGR